jgi:uncharacterized damage-inducible protein DinB
MNKQQLDQMWDHLRQVNGIAIRCVELIPESKLDSHPIPNMRTPKELVVHLYAMPVREVTEGSARGEIVDIDEKAIVAEIRTKDDLLHYCKDSWAAADKARHSMTDAKLTSLVKTPWGGMQFPAFVGFGITHDELLHHRGQLYAFLRQMGAEVPEMWDFEYNAPEYGPKAATQA